MNQREYERLIQAHQETENALEAIESEIDRALATEDADTLLLSNPKYRDLLNTWRGEEDRLHALVLEWEDVKR